MAHLSPVNQARWARFRHHRRGFWSLWIFLVLFGLSLCSELIANDKPLLVRYDGSWYFPLVKNYSESDFGGPLATRADYQDPWLKQQLESRGWVLWAPVRFGANSINFATDKPFPSPPSAQNWLGTDANGGDVLARVLYGTRISILFGLMLTLCSSVMGVLAGALQGYYGGKVDLWGQRFIEVWSGMPTLFLIILLSSVLTAAVTAFAGPVSFIGLAVPHICRILMRTSDSRILIPAGMLGGALMAGACDFAARTVVSPAELPLGAITAIIGAPVVVFLLTGREKL